MLRLQSVRLSTIAHATEDRDKVKRAMWSACPQQEFHSRIAELRLKGHHGNEIHLLTMTIPPIKKPAYIEFLWKRLSRLDQQSVLGSLEHYLDERNVLHLRFSKQDSFLGRLRFGDDDVIKVELSFRNFSDPRKKATDETRKLLSELDQSSRNLSQA